MYYDRWRSSLEFVVRRFIAESADPRNSLRCRYRAHARLISVLASVPAGHLPGVGTFDEVVGEPAAVSSTPAGASSTAVTQVGSATYPDPA